MKKGLIALIISFIAFVSLLSMSSCSGAPKKLGAPEGLKRDRRVMIWDPVENASGYKVSINDEEYTVTECRFELYYLDGGTYEFEVMAVGDKVKTTDSEYVSQTVSFEEPPKIVNEGILTCELLDDRSGYQVRINGLTYRSPDETIVVPDFIGDYPVTAVRGLNVCLNTDSKFVQQTKANIVTKYVI